MADGNRPKFSYLKKGIGQARILQRNVILNPPPPDISSSSSKTQTSTQSLPLIENLSPITKEPVTNIRPTTAETGDSGVRDVNLHVSPTFDSASVRTTVTTYHRESPPKVPAQDDQANPTNEPIHPANAQNFQIVSQNVPEKQNDENIFLRPDTSTPSHTKSFTSLDRIKTPPIQPQINANESDEQFSNFSAEIVASSRSKDSASVGTSRIHEFAHNDSVATLRANIDSNSRLHGATAGTSHSHQNRPYPTTHSQNDDQETPLNSRSRPPLFKSCSYGSLPYSTQRPYIDQTARRLGIHPIPNYILRPHPKALQVQTPDAVNGLGTPQASSTKNNSFFKTPLLPKSFVNKEEGKIVESLAEQLRALIICFDAGMDGRLNQINQLKYIYAEKAKALKRKEQEMNKKFEAEEKKIIAAKAKLKLESDKMKESDGILKKTESELKEVKSRFVDTSRNLADIRQAKNQVEQKLKKVEEELQKEKEKAQQWKSLNEKLSNELSLERRMKEFIAKQSGNKASTTGPPQKEQTRQPFRLLQTQRQIRFGMQQNIPETNFPFPPQQQQQEPSQRKLTNTSTSSVESGSRHIQWNLPNAENHNLSNNENFTSLRTHIPSDSQLLHKIDDQSFIEEQYRRFGFYRIMKECQCEIIRYDNNDLRYCCLKDVNVNVSYVDENGQITITLPNGYIINTFPSMQLEIHRTETNEKSIVAPDGRRCEYFNFPNGAEHFVDVFVSKDEGQRQYPDGRVEVLENMNTKRNDTDFVQLIENALLFCCPGFFVNRHLDKDFGGGVTVRVLTEDPQKIWKITICPEHRVFYVKHYNGNTNRRCFYTERRCDHLRN
uniref:Uncharacterized protein n=1 Tax=Panagrolaimus sp. ES5 TaxID=591445 RepID=A0AC34FC39_9BILA